MDWDFSSPGKYSSTCYPVAQVEVAVGNIQAISRRGRGAEPEAEADVGEYEACPSILTSYCTYLGLGLGIFLLFKCSVRSKVRSS